MWVLRPFAEWGMCSEIVAKYSRRDPVAASSVKPMPLFNAERTKHRTMQDSDDSATPRPGVNSQLKHCLKRLPKTRSMGVVPRDRPYHGEATAAPL
jgi:hypothetical protein